MIAQLKQNLITQRRRTMNKFLAIISLAALAGCSSAPVYQPLPPVKVITETVQLEIYQPPLPQEIKMQDVDWFVLTNSPCKPATGTDRKLGYHTTEQFQYQEVVKEDGTTSRQVVRDADGNRVELPQLTDGNGVIQVCGNLEQKIAEIEKQLGGDFVIMAITPKGYENMAYNLQEIKRYLNQQKEIVMYYREATGGNKNDEPEEWLEKNSQHQAEQIQDAQTSNQQPVATEPLAPPVSSGLSLKSLIPIL
jgi:hypothetical protein